MARPLEWWQPPGALPPARTQLRLALLTVLAVTLIDVLVAVQAHRWYKRSATNPRLKLIRRVGAILLLAELAHVALVSVRLERFITRFVGVTLPASAASPPLGPHRNEQLLLLASCWVLITIGGPVNGGFTWRGYQITKKLGTKVVLGSLWALTCMAALVGIALNSAVISYGPSFISRESYTVVLVFTWLCAGENVSLAWVFYKELILDRRGRVHDERDAVTDFAVEALSHQAPLMAVMFCAAVAISQFSAIGLALHEMLIQLYSPICLLSGLTALLSHDKFHQRVHQSHEFAASTRGRAAPPGGIHVRKEQVVFSHRRKTDDPTFWRADMSHISQSDGPAVSQIQVEQVTSLVVDGPVSQLPTLLEDDYFSFDLSALERARPAVTRPSVRWGAQTLPARLPAAPPNSAAG